MPRRATIAATAITVTLTLIGAGVSQAAEPVPTPPPSAAPPSAAPPSAAPPSAQPQPVAPSPAPRPAPNTNGPSTPPHHPAETTGWARPQTLGAQLRRLPDAGEPATATLQTTRVAGRLVGLARDGDGQVWVRLRFADGRGGYLPGADAVRAPAPVAISPATETALRSIQVRLGPASAIVVRDPFGRTLIELGTRRPLSLASVTKLGTMTAALGRFPVDPGTARAVLGSSNNGLAQRLSNRLGNGSAARGARTAREAVATLGVRMNLVDGSGLDYRNRASAQAIADLLIAVREQPRFATIYANLPIAARTGTLAGRMHATTAAGRVRAKTGTLYEHPTSTLAGYVWPAGYGLRPERALVAVVLTNGIHPDRSRPLQDAVMRELTAPGAFQAPPTIAAP